MANDITGTPWNLNTVGVITTSRVYIGNIFWLNGTGNLVPLDNNGRDVILDAWTTSSGSSLWYL